ncbi:MAG: L-aspartate oxidase, partial [Alphaproteobacteria bacterium]|nr:L-aspartate oxidase [Alphaproteobacteria bacterium]
PLPAKPAPNLPGDALQRLRKAMSRDAGVVRDAGGLNRLLTEIDALEAAHGAAPALTAARLVAACALARSESRGAHFRADAQDPKAPLRTFLRLSDLPAASPFRFAAE